MLEELHIHNYAIIDQLHLRFQEGLNILTGETGAGKSIIIGAIHLLLGGKGSADQIRAEEDEAMVEALFHVGEMEALKKKVEERGYGLNDKLLIKRTLSRTGRSRAYINGQIATLQILSEIGKDMINIYGQHEHQSLLQPERHIDLLDEFGGLIHLQREVFDLYEGLGRLKREIKELIHQNKLKREKQELWEFQLNEINRARLREGEDQSLEEERKVLANAQKLFDLASLVEEELYSAEPSIITIMDRNGKRLSEMAEIDQNLRQHEQSLCSMVFQLEDLTREIRRYREGIPFDIERLKEVEGRLDELWRLKKKYGPELSDVLKLRDRLEKELEGFADYEERSEGLKRELKALEDLLIETAQELSLRRQEAAGNLCRRIKKELMTLGFRKAKFEVRIERLVPFPAEHGDEDEVDRSIPCGPKGIDLVWFYLSTTVGEPLKPLHKVASGGELSRIMLAMKEALAKAGKVPTLVFDEIDSGIGGGIAEIVGKKLIAVSKDHQVFCITHLPQIACFARTHYLVRKLQKGRRTATDVTVLSSRERIEEIARMLGGTKVTDKTREHAMEMIETVRG